MSGRVGANPSELTDLSTGSGCFRGKRTTSVDFDEPPLTNDAPQSDLAKIRHVRVLFVKEDLGGSIVEIPHVGHPVSSNGNRFDSELPINQLRRCDLVTTLDSLDGIWCEANNDPPDVPRKEATVSRYRQDVLRRRKLLNLRFPDVGVKPSWAFVNEDLSMTDCKLPTGQERDPGIAPYRRSLCRKCEGGRNDHLAIDHVRGNWARSGRSVPTYPGKYTDT